MKKTTFSNITFKASHNSYGKEETSNEQLTFDTHAPYHCGCMALEFDIWRHSSTYEYLKEIDKNYFTVNHIGPGKTKLVHYLDEVLDWHKKNQHHPIILITLDIKSSRGGCDFFHKEIDTYLKCYFDETIIFKPNQLMTDETLSLCENVIMNGWPDLSSSELQGKFIFCLSGNKKWKSKYAATNLHDRFCFSDEDISASDKEVSPPTKGNVVFFNFHISDHNKEVWMNTIPPFAEKNLITRIFVANTEADWNNCINANVSAIATDKINSTWAKVSDSCEYKIKKTTLDKRSLRNKSNKEYRTDHATKMQEKYESPACMFIFEKQNDATNVYAIRNAKNKEYLDSTITSMSKTITGPSQKWKLIEVDSKDSEYYVQNLENHEYLTKRASKLSKHAEKDEIYIINSVQ